MKPDICIYHGNCADGFGAAWAVWKRFGDAVEFVPGVYGQEPPAVGGKHVLMVDFSYKRSVLGRMACSAASIVILDHHKTAEADLAAVKVTMCGGAKFAASQECCATWPSLIGRRYWPSSTWPAPVRRWPGIICFPSKPARR